MKDSQPPGVLGPLFSDLEEAAACPGAGLWGLVGIGIDACLDEGQLVAADSLLWMRANAKFPSRVLQVPWDQPWGRKTTWVWVLSFRPSDIPSYLPAVVFDRLTLEMCKTNTLGSQAEYPSLWAAVLDLGEALQDLAGP